MGLGGEATQDPVRGTGRQQFPIDLLDAGELLVTQIGIIHMRIADGLTEKAQVEREVGRKRFRSSVERLVDPEPNQCTVDQTLEHGGVDRQHFGRVVLDRKRFDFAAHQVKTAAVPAGRPVRNVARHFGKISPLLLPAIEIAPGVEPHGWRGRGWDGGRDPPLLEIDAYVPILLDGVAGDRQDRGDDDAVSFD